MVSGKYVYAGKKRCAKYQKFILIPDNASWYTAIRSESLIKASYKIVKRLFCLNYILQKYHRPVRNVAMVCVAAVALGSSTYAWFVKNNKVDATTSTISAQSNAAYMTIKNGTSGASSVDTTSVTTTVATKPLYPATLGEEQGVTKGKFMTGYGTDLNDGSLKGNLKLVGTEGSYSDATGADYALQQDFNISSKGQNLAKLSIDKIEDKSAQTSGLKMPLRVLVTNDAGTVWGVYGKDAAGTA